MAARDLNYEDEHFECADAGAADTYPMAAADLKKGGAVCIRGRPCKIIDVDVYQVGKHGATKASIEGEDMFTGRKLEFVAPGSYGMPCPFVHKSEYMLIDIDDKSGALSLLDDESKQRCDLDLPADESLAAAIRAHFAQGKTLMLSVHKAMGIEAVMSFKVDTGR